ncbi:MAG: polysaccharide biosynthesis protein [Nitrospirota bacterium]|nr:polysaccharide biosynthesis protein [Nitrospirota bacterium]
MIEIMHKQRIKQILVFVSDALLVSASLFISYSLRFGTLMLSEEQLRQILFTLPLALIIRLFLFYNRGLYRGMWRFVSVRDLIVLLQSATFGSLFIVGLLFLFQRLNEYPRSVFIIDWFIVIVLVGGSRFTYRLYREGWFKVNIANSSDPASKKILIVGAGRAGEMILREILGNYRLGYAPVGFVDDNRAKRNLTIHGYKVLGNTRDIPNIVEEHKVEEVFLAIPVAPSKAKRRIMMTCKNAHVKFKTLPAVGDILDGTVKVSALREFQIEDLLGRESAKLDTGAIKSYLREKTVMITGAGGSIGSELCRQVAKYSPKQLILFERSEFNLYQIHMTLMELFPDLELHPVIGDVLNQQRVEKTLKQFMPEVIFHAAAYKHVPLMEINPDEALINNVLGTWTVAHLAVTHGVRKFVMVSTDKAVRPTNIMGASKRIAELICQGLGESSKTKFVTVRFGNVLNSIGSVIPRFKEQIAKGGPVTVTHPEIYRYFMTIPEAVQLIMQAGAMGQGGEIFILDMGEPVKIVDLARDMISLSGLEPDKDIKIVFTGLRPGEKLYEELLTQGEEIKSTLHEKIKVAAAEQINWPILLGNIEALLDELQKGFKDRTVNKIKLIVPDYQPEKGGPGTVIHSIRDMEYEIIPDIAN